MAQLLGTQLSDQSPRAELLLQAPLFLACVPARGSSFTQVQDLAFVLPQFCEVSAGPISPTCPDPPSWQLYPPAHQLGLQSAVTCELEGELCCLLQVIAKDVKQDRSRTDLLPQNYSLTTQVKLGDIKTQEKADNFTDSKSNADSKIASYSQKHSRRCKDQEIIKVASKTNLKPWPLPFSEFEIPLLYRLQKHIPSELQSEGKETGKTCNYFNPEKILSFFVQSLEANS